jgi:putative glutamine amidotransferase
MQKIPLIGITLDAEQPGGYSKMPWYALRQNYCDSVWQTGGLPVPVPHLVDAVPHYLEILDGLVITGGAFDIPPSLYGDDAVHQAVTTKDARTAAEWALTKGMLERNKPVLGICGGQQLLAVILGGTLIQHIPDSIPHALAHEQPNPRTEPGHSVAILPNTLLHKIVQKQVMHVNSAHHQAVKTVPAGVVINATAEDGVVEGIESTAHKFCVGVQWHPEYQVDADDFTIFQAFVKACHA